LLQHALLDQARNDVSDKVDGEMGDYVCKTAQRCANCTASLQSTASSQLSTSPTTARKWSYRAN